MFISNPYNICTIYKQEVVVASPIYRQVKQCSNNTQGPSIGWHYHTACHKRVLPIFFTSGALHAGDVVQFFIQMVTRHDEV